MSYTLMHIHTVHKHPDNEEEYIWVCMRDPRLEYGYEIEGRVEASNYYTPGTHLIIPDHEMRYTCMQHFELAGPNTKKYYKPKETIAKSKSKPRKKKKTRNRSKVRGY